MMKKKLSVVLTAVMTVLLLLPVSVAARTAVDTSINTELTIVDKDGSTIISGARFDIYQVAEVGEYGDVTLCTPFDDASKYPIDFSDMIYGSGTDEEIQDAWKNLALTLKGYVKKDDIPAYATEYTDNNGEIQISLPAGIYFVAGCPRTIDGTTYFATPYMIHVPGLDSEDDWIYELTSNVKNGKDVDTDKYVTRKAIKVWDDEGYESIRPEEVVVNLMYDSETESGVVYDTQVLNKENNWQFAWDNLDAKNDWYVVEDAMENYKNVVEPFTAKTDSGIDGSVTVFTITNTYIPPLNPQGLIDPPVTKKISGSTPRTTTDFRFQMTGVYSDAVDVVPMPEGSDGNKKIMTISGAGSMEFGEIDIVEEGDYIYQIKELNDGAKGYTYDKTIHTLVFHAEIIDNEMVITVIQTTDFAENDPALKDGSYKNKLAGQKFNSTIESSVFENIYEALPHTGIYWWPIPVLLAGGVVFILIGFISKKGNKVA